MGLMLDLLEINLNCLSIAGFGIGLGVSVIIGAICKPCCISTEMLRMHSSLSHPY